MRALWLAMVLGTVSAAAVGPAPLARAAPAWVEVDRVIAVVNRDVVLASDLERRMGTFKPQLAAIVDAAERQRQRLKLREESIRGLIDERLVLQEAARFGLDAPDAEIDQAITQIKQQNQLDDAGLNKALSEAGFTMTAYRQEVRRQIIQMRVVNLVVRARIQVTDAEVKAAYRELKAREPGVKKFSEVQDHLRNELVGKALAVEQQRWIAERRAASHIEVLK